MLWMLLGALLALGALYGYSQWRRTQGGKKTLPSTWLKRLARLRRSSKEKRE
jgi:predicted negative regulator of RcsB-dependent stress response